MDKFNKQVEDNIGSSTVATESKQPVEEKDSYSLSAFFLTFVYYLMKGNRKVGIALLLSVAVLPKNFYFVVGLIAGFFVGKDRERSISLKGVLIACLGILVLCFLKVVRFKLLGSI